MDIDILFTEHGEAGLISSENPITKAVGVLFDPATGIMTLEYTDMDFLEMNIPVDAEFFGLLDRCPQLHFGVVKGGNIGQAYQVPLMFLDDPYRGQKLAQVSQLQNPLVAFDYFVKECVSGQPVHRDDLNDDNLVSVLGEAAPSALQFAPHLARRHSLEAAPRIAPGGPAAPGLGTSGGGAPYRDSSGEEGKKRK